MATTTTNYGMTIAEGADIVNPLTQIFPNFNTIDSAMFANKQTTIGTATEVTTGTVHAIVRGNTDSDVFRFTATSAWTAGDTMTLDGNAVTVHMTDGTTPATGSYIIGAEVLAMVNGSLVTLAISSNGGVNSFNGRTGAVTPAASDYDASMIDFDNTNTQLTSTDVQGAIEEVAAAFDHGSVQVTTDGIKTYSQVLDSLRDLVDVSKIRNESKLLLGGFIYNLVRNASRLYFTTTHMPNTSTYQCSEAAVGVGTSIFYRYDGTTITDLSSTVPTVGDNVILYY